VARVHNLGQVQRRLAGLRFEPSGDGTGDGTGDGLPAPRTDLVTDDGRRAGQLRSVVDHPRLGPIGLAYVRRVVDDGRLVRAGDRVATVVALPFD
jgi:folate-binding Fe-S cluster repair protein YgfZ